MLTNFAALTPQQKLVWSRDVWSAARDQMFVKRFLGTGQNAMIQRITELTKTEKGEQVIMHLVADLVQDGVIGDNEREGNEESMQSYSQIITIDQLTHSVRNKGKLADQKTVINFREMGKERLANWLATRTDQLAFLTLSGISYAFQNNGAARVGSPFPNLTFAADVSAPSAKRSLMWDGTSLAVSATGSITTGYVPSYKMIVDLIAYAKENYVKPLMEGGKEYYVLLVAPGTLAAVGADEGANLGTAFHGFTEADDLGLMHFARKVWHGKIRNYREGLQAQGLQARPEFIERKVVVLRYGLAGTLDRLLLDEMAEEKVLRTGDLKSQKRFWTWLEISAQLAAYAMADAMWDRARCCYVEMPPVAQDFAVVAWMPVNGLHYADAATSAGDPDGVDFFNVDLDKGREALELCYRVDRMRSEAKSKAQTWGLLRPAPVLTVVEAYARRIGSVSSLAEGSALWAEIVKAGVHEVPELIELAQERVGQLQSELAMR